MEFGRVRRRNPVSPYLHRLARACGVRLTRGTRGGRIRKTATQLAKEIRRVHAKKSCGVRIRRSRPSASYRKRPGRPRKVGRPRKAVRSGRPRKVGRPRGAGRPRSSRGRVMRYVTGFGPTLQGMMGPVLN